MPESFVISGTWADVNAANAELTQSDFSYASLNGIDFTGARLQGTIWTGAALGAITLSASTVCPDGFNFNFTGADLCRGSLPGY